MKRYLFVAFLFLHNFDFGNTLTDSISITREIDQIDSSRRNNSSHIKRKLIRLSQEERIVTSPFHVSRCYSILGDIYLVEAKYDSAKYYFEKALKIRKDNNYLPYLASTFESISQLHKTLGEDSTALSYLHKSLKIKTELGNKDYLKSIHNNLGNTYFDLEQFDSASYFYKQVLSISSSQNDTQGIAASYSNIGRVLYHQDSNMLAIASYQKAIDLYKKSDRISELVPPLFNVGNTYQWLKKNDSAMRYYNLAHVYAIKGRSLSMLGEIYLALTEIHTLSGNNDSSIIYLRKYLDYQDSVFSESKVNAILEFETQYQTKEKEQALKLEKITNKNNQKAIIALIILAILLVFIVVFVFRFFKQKKKVDQLEVNMKNQKIDQLLKEQEAKTYAALIEGQSFERKRIAQDLHDKLGGSLAAVKVHFNLMNEKIEDKKQENKVLFDKMNGMLEEAVKDVRNISHNLSTGKLARLGLRATLEDLISIISSAKNIDFELDIQRNFQLPQQKTEQEIYAIVQELVSNTLKHASAKHITLTVNNLNNVVGLIYEDDGVGFNIDLSKEKGLGLSGIERRVHNLDGTLSIDSVVGRGTIIIINIPL